FGKPCGGTPTTAPLECGSGNSASCGAPPATSDLPVSTLRVHHQGRNVTLVYLTSTQRRPVAGSAKLKVGIAQFIISTVAGWKCSTTDSKVACSIATLERERAKALCK